MFGSLSHSKLNRLKRLIFSQTCDKAIVKYVRNAALSERYWFVYWTSFYCHLMGYRDGVGYRLENWRFRDEVGLENGRCVHTL